MIDIQVPDHDLIELYEKFREEKQPDVEPSTWENYERPIEQFLMLCGSRGIYTVADVMQTKEPGEINIFVRYRNVHLNQKGNSKTGVAEYLSKIKGMFIHFEELLMVPSEVVALARHAIPDLSRREKADNTAVPAGVQREALKYLKITEPYKLRTVVFALLHDTYRRCVDLEALDVEDFVHKDQGYVVEFTSRDGTRLKKGSESDTYVTLNDETGEIIEGYLKYERPDYTDEQDREPLLVTPGTNGNECSRLSKSWMRQLVFSALRPCEYGECPHGRDELECEAAGAISGANGCPSSEGPHAVRSGMITNAYVTGVEVDDISDRVDASPDTLREHYIWPDSEELMEARREEWAAVFDDISTGG